MEQIYQEIDVRLYQTASKRNELLQLLADARYTVTPESESLLLKPKFRSVLLQYLQYHSLREVNQPTLFELGNSELLTFFVTHWSLTSECEKKLFAVKYRPYLKQYIKRGCLADAGNEVLFFNQVGMAYLRRLYISLYEFHSREAEVMLLESEYEADLRLYIGQQHHMFPDLAEILATEHPDLYAQYIKHCPSQQ